MCFAVFYCLRVIYVCLHTHVEVPDIGLAVRVFANRPGGLGSIPGRVIPKTQKMVLDDSLRNTQQYKVRIKGSGAIQGKEYRPTLHLGVVSY